MNKSISAMLLVSALYLPAIQACEQFSDSEAEQLLTILKNVNSNNADTESYQFLVNSCIDKNYQNSGRQLSSYKKHEKSRFHHPNKS